MQTGASAAQGTPTLVVPTDSAKWRDMQRNLVVGGVYHVQQQGNPPHAARYCLWNGSTLVPCKCCPLDLCHSVLTLKKVLIA